MATTPINLDELKTQLAALKTRSDAILAKKDGLIAEAAAQDQKQQQARKELVDLGYPQAESMDLTALAELAEGLTAELTQSLAALNTAVSDAETLLGIAQKADSLDL